MSGTLEQAVKCVCRLPTWRSANLETPARFQGQRKGKKAATVFPIFVRGFWEIRRPAIQLRSEKGVRESTVAPTFRGDFIGCLYGCL